MPDRPVLTVECWTQGYVTTCSTHGYLAIWGSPVLANFDLWGHAAHFHSRPLPATTW